MLTTLLSIGACLRAQPGIKGLLHHRYIASVPAFNRDRGENLTILTVSVADDMTFDLTKAEEQTNENELSSLCYLNYKTSDADSLKKYIFGDICRFQVPVPKSSLLTERVVNFVLGEPDNKAAAFRVNSFFRGVEDSRTLNNPLIGSFRACLARQMDNLLALFKQYPSVYINFRFGPEQKHWYEQTEAVDAINAKLISQFAVEVPGIGFALTKFLYKNLSASKGTTTYFRGDDSNKTWIFSNIDEVMNLLYAVDYSQRALLKRGDIKIVILPRRDTPPLDAEDIQQFFGTVRSKPGEKDAIQVASEREADLEPAVVLDEEEEDTADDPLLRPLERARYMRAISIAESGLSFDFVFSRASSVATRPDVDVVELSGLTQSRLTRLQEDLKAIREQLNAKRRSYFAAKNIVLKRVTPLFVLDCLNNVFSEVGRDKKKYASHLLKVVPQIYAGSYVQDDLLTTVFIETVERHIREGKPNYDFLQFDLLFLKVLQNANQTGDVRTVEEMKETMLGNPYDEVSYEIGRRLGKIARPLRQEINSFEKNYVGLLSRRIAQLSDVVVFLNYMNEKLVMHERNYPDLRQASREVADMLRSFKGTYNREFCALGFFEAYYEPIPQKEKPLAGQINGAAQPDAGSANNTKEEN